MDEDVPDLSRLQIFLTVTENGIGNAAKVERAGGVARARVARYDPHAVGA